MLRLDERGILRREGECWKSGKDLHGVADRHDIWLPYVPVV